MHTGIQSSLYWGKVISLGVILGISIQFAAAWTNPTVSAPGGNVAGPVNTGTISQVKSAGLGLTGNLVVGGQIQQSLANCDLKSNASGVLYCGTDATGGGLGVDQTWQVFTPAWGPVRSNGTGKPILVQVTVGDVSHRSGYVNHTYADLWVGGVLVSRVQSGHSNSDYSVAGSTLSAIIPPGQSYFFQRNSTDMNFTGPAVELR